MKIKRADWIIFIAAILLFGSALLFITLFHSEGGTVEVYVDGVQTAAYPLDQDTDVVITGYDGGTNELQIRDHRAKIISADCPDKSCTHQKAISAGNETIVCLPHRLVIRLEEGPADDARALDGVAG